MDANDLQDLHSKVYGEAFLRLYPDWLNLKLYPQEIQVIEYSYGLNNKPLMSAAEIGALLKLSRTEVQVIKENTLRKIKVRHKNNLVPRPELTKQLRCANREIFLTQYPEWEKADLTPHQKQIIELFYGLSGEPPKSTSQVGEVLGVSRQAVSKTLKIALKKINELNSYEQLSLEQSE
jgi:DNA-directed RNA polymerase sigma subunit (sigma70/sigma32)